MRTRRTSGVLKAGLMAALSAMMIILPSTMSRAETWIASCNNLQFNFDRSAGTYLLYFQTSSGIFQMGKGKINFDNGTALRGALTGNSVLTNGEPLTEIGLNPSRGMVYVLYRNPVDNTVKSGDFCRTTIRIQ